MMWPHEADAGWPGAVVPLQVGVLQTPSPSARRCYKLGQSLRKAIESYPEDLSVVLVATGGLSHQVHGERAGFNNPEWDMQLLDMMENDPETLTQLTIADYAHRGGWESAEVVMWLIMRGALSANVKKIHQSYYLPSMTALATAVYENQATDPTEEAKQAYRAHIYHALEGADELEGTYPFTLQNSVKAYRLNKFLHKLTEPAHRERFLSDPEASFEEAQLTAEEQEMIRRRDWPKLIHYGVIFFLLEKLGAVIGVSNPHIYAAMRGETLEEFQKTRNANVLYSVAGDPKLMTWDEGEDESKTS
jgi:gallate dioxygenase